VTVYTQTDYTYDNSNGNTLLTTISGTDAENTTTTNTWVDKGNWTWRLQSQSISGSWSGLVRETDYTYFSNGNLETETYWHSEGPDPVTSYTYDDYGNLKTSTDPNGNTIDIWGSHLKY
jgi:YD repeat-containing protein